MPRVRSDVPLAEGVLPRHRHEIVISAEVADRPACRVGDRMEAVASGRDLEVVGVTRPRTAPTTDRLGGPTSRRRRRLGPGDADRAAAAPGRATSPPVSPSTGTPTVSHGPGRPTVASYTQRLVERRGQGHSWSPAQPGRPSAIGFVATVCSAAFAIGARRQLRGLGTLAATGPPRPTWCGP